MVIMFRVPKISFKLACIIRDKMALKGINNWSIFEIDQFFEEESTLVTVVNLEDGSMHRVAIEDTLWEPAYTDISTEVA